MQSLGIRPYVFLGDNKRTRWSASRRAPKRPRNEPAESVAGRSTVSCRDPLPQDARRLCPLLPFIGKFAVKER